MKDYKARSDFARGFFEIAGFFINEIIVKPENISLIKDNIDQNIRLAVLCSSDSLYEETAVNISREIKSQKKDVFLLLAGNPGHKEKEYRDSGIDDFIHLETNVYEKLHFISGNVFNIKIEE